MSTPARNTPARVQVAILDLLDAEARPMTATEIVWELGLDGPSVETVKAVCDRLVTTGEARRSPGRPARFSVTGERAEGE